MSCGQRTNRIVEGLRRSRSESAANGLEWTEATFIFKEAFLFGQGDTCLVSTSMTHFHHRHHHHHSSHGHHHGCHDDDEEEEEDPHWHDHQIEWFHDAHEWSNDNSSGHQEDEFSTPKGKDIVNSSRTTWPAASHSENPPVVAMHGHLMGNNPYNAYDRSHGGHFNRRAQRTHQKQVFASLLDDQDPQESANSIPSPPNEMDMGISSNDDLNFQTDDPKMDDDIAQENQTNYAIQDDDQPLVESFANETDHDENNIREVFLKCPEDVKNLLRDRLEELAQNANQNTVRSCLGPSIDDALFRLFGVVRRWLNSWTSTAGSGECACGTECGAMTTCALKWLHHEYLGLADELVAASKLNDGGNETRRLASKRKLLDGLSKLLNNEHTQIEFAKIQSSSSPTSPSLVYDDDFEDTEEEVGNWDQNSSENSIIRESVQEANMNQMQAGLGALAQSSKPRGNICKGGCCGGGCSAGQNCQKMFLGDTRPVTNYSEMSRVSSNQEKNKPFYSSQAFHKQNLQRIFRMRRIEDSKPCICQKEDILVHGKRNSSRNSTTKRNSFNPSSFIGNLNPAFPGRMRNEERQKKKVSHRMRSKALEKNFRGNDPLNSLTTCREPQYPHWPPQHQYNFDTSDPLLIVQNGSNEYEEQMRASKEMRHSTLPTNEESADIYQELPDTGCNNPCCEKLKSCAPYDVNNRSSLSDSGIPPVQSPTPPLREESKRISSATVNYNRNSTGDLKKTVPIADKIECPAKKEEEEMLLRIMTKLNLIEERLDREQTSKEVEPVKKKRSSRRHPRRASSRHCQDSSDSSTDLSKSRGRVLRKRSSRKHSSSSEERFHDNNFYKGSKECYLRSRCDHCNSAYDEDRNKSFIRTRDPSTESKKNFFHYLLQLRKSKRSRRKRKEQKINLLYSRSSSDDSSLERSDRDGRNLFDIIYEPKFPNKKPNNPQDPSHNGWENMHCKLHNIPSHMYVRLVKDRSPFAIRNTCINEDIKPTYQDKSAQITRSPTFEDAATCTEENICANNLPSNIQSSSKQIPREYQKQIIHTPPTMLYRAEYHTMDEIPVKDISFPKPKRDDNVGLCLQPGSSVGHSLKQIGLLDGVKVLKRSSSVMVDPDLGARITQLHAKVSKRRKDLNIRANEIMKQQISNQSLAALLAERSRLLHERDNVPQTPDNISSLITSSSNQRSSLGPKRRSRRRPKRRQKEFGKQLFGVHNSLYKTVTGTLGAWLANNWIKEELKSKNQKKY